MAQSTSTRSEEEAALVKIPDNIPPWRHVSSYLLNGSSNELAVDGSGGSPQTFSYSPPATPPPSYDFIANLLIFYMQTATAMSATVFGDLGAALGTGIEIKADGVLLTTWKDNADIWTEVYDVDTLANVSDAAADTSINGRWLLTQDTNGSGIVIPQGSSFEAIVNDDLSGITSLRIRIKGKLIATGKRQ
jgi:hypothetical protein